MLYQHFLLNASKVHSTPVQLNYFEVTVSASKYDHKGYLISICTVLQPENRQLRNEKRLIKTKRVRTAKKCTWKTNQQQGMETNKGGMKFRLKNTVFGRLTTKQSQRIMLSTPKEDICTAWNRQFPLRRAVSLTTLAYEIDETSTKIYHNWA